MANRSKTRQAHNIAALQHRLSELERRIHEQEAADQSLQVAVEELAAELKQAESAPALPPDQVHLNRLSQLGEMAASLAHQLNQPLTAITTYSRACLRMLRSDAPDSEALTRALERVVVQAEHAAAFVRCLRQFLAHRKPQRAPVDVNELVRDVIFLCEPELIADSVTLDLRLAERLPRLALDRMQIEQVLLNLIRNALDAMKHSPPRRQLTLRTALKRGEVEVSVGDTGPGLPHDLRENLFQPFRTTKPHGLGLGLTISRSLVEAHQGRLWAKPNAECGTTFVFVLPMVLRVHHNENAPHRLPGR
jgi:two-component system sensor kinase FixL